MRSETLEKKLWNFSAGPYVATERLHVSFWARCTDTFLYSQVLPSGLVSLRWVTPDTITGS